MLYIIDAYNYIAYVTGHKKSSSRQIRSVVRDIIQALNRANHQALIVFDGGVMIHQERSVVGPCTILYPGIGRTADEYILEHVGNHPRATTVVVTADREIRAGVQAKGYAPMRPGEFGQILADLQVAAPAGVKSEDTGTRKYSNYASTHEIDRLMEQAANSGWYDQDKEPE